MKHLFLALILFALCGCQPSANIPKAENNQSAANPTPPAANFSPAAVPSVKEPPKEATEILNSILELEQRGRGMERLRKNDPAKCGEAMRANQKTADEVLVKSKTLPNPYRATLGSAASNLSGCVQCSSGAITYCDMVNKDIENYNKSLITQ